jgi:hypothetical protein
MEERFASPDRGGFRQYLESSLGAVFQDHEYAAVAAEIVEGLVFICHARNFGKPQCPMIVDRD